MAGLVPSIGGLGSGVLASTGGHDKCSRAGESESELVENGKLGCAQEQKGISVQLARRINYWS